jgi:hypothetical protein
MESNMKESVSQPDQKGDGGRRRMERETRFELATNSLEGCDSTIELPPLNIIPVF